MITTWKLLSAGAALWTMAAASLWYARKSLRSIRARRVISLAAPGLLLAIVACSFRLEPETEIALLALSNFMLAAAVFFIGLSARRTLVLMLALLFLAPHSKAAGPKNPGCVAIVVVIIIGGYTYYRLYKACQHLKPKPLPDDDTETNSPPKLAKDIAGHSIALNRPWQSFYCDCDEGKSTATASTFPFELRSNGNRITGRAITNLVSQDQFEAFLMNDGIDFNQAGTQFSAGPNPISFDPSNPYAVTIGTSTNTQILERSYDLMTWQEIARLNTDGPFAFSDESAEPMAFYRITKP